MTPTDSPPNSEQLSHPRLRAVLAARELTFARLAHRLDVCERYLAYVIRGKRQSATLLRALRDHLGEPAWRFVAQQSSVLDMGEPNPPADGVQAGDCAVPR